MSTPLPNFFLAGTVKSGSTSLYYFLDEHPGIYMSPIKEPHFFSAGDMNYDQFRPLIKKRAESFDLQAYLRKNVKRKVHRAYITQWDDYIQLFRDVKNETRIGEASTSYLWAPGAAKRIHDRIPDAKIIIVLRNPVERAFSHYLMDIKNELASGSFSEALKADDAIEKPSWGKCAMYVQSGMYASQVQRYYDTFPEKQILVVLFDELKKDPANTVQLIYRFLDVDPSFKPDFSVKHNASFLPAGKWSGRMINNIFLRKLVIDRVGQKVKEPLKKIFFKTTGLPVMNEEEKSALHRTFEKDIVSLQKLINKDLSPWLR